MKMMMMFDERVVDACFFVDEKKESNGGVA